MIHQKTILLENSAIEELASLMETLNIEREDEIQEFKELQKNKSLKERVGAGVTIFPLRMENMGVSYGSYPYVLLERHPQQKGGALLQNGSKVNLFKTSEDETLEFEGRILNLNGSKIKVLLYTDDLSKSDMHGKWGLDLMYDDKTYDAMAWALNHWINETDKDKITFRDTVLGYKKPTVAEHHSFDLP
ncbi:MAG: hypothetical protein HRT74_13990, partial [Flavobacteriales bacterium]|nr:hypothetical protein [Flavobacteriales bacterium]